MSGLLLLLLFAFTFLLAILIAQLVHGARNPKRHTAAYAIARGWPCDPGDLGLNCDAFVIERPDGARLPAWIVNGEAGPLTVLFVHGWGQGRVDMLQHIDPFRDHPMVFYDLRGHGESEGSPSHLGAGEENDLLDLLERLESDRVLLVGYSMGAVIALHAAAAGHPATEKIAGVISHGPYDDLHTPLRGRLAVQELPARPLTDIAMAIFRFLGLRHRTTVSIAGHIECPVLIVHGRHDPISPFEHGRRLAAAITGATLYEVEQGRHLDVAQVDGDAYREEVSAWIEALPGGDEWRIIRGGEANGSPPRA